MFRRKANKEEATSQPAAPQAAAQTYAGGYQVTELPTYDKGKRKVVVYTSDANGKIIKRFKR